MRLRLRICRPSFPPLLLVKASHKAKNEEIDSTPRHGGTVMARGRRHRDREAVHWPIGAVKLPTHLVQVPIKKVTILCNLKDVASKIKFNIPRKRDYCQKYDA